MTMNGPSATSTTTLVRVGPGVCEVHIGGQRVGAVVRRVAGRGHVWHATSSDGRYIGTRLTASGAATLLLEDDGPER